EFEPGLPISVGADAVKQFIISLPIRLEIQAEVKNGLTDSASDAQQERNQQAAQPSVSVQEGVNGFELYMHEGRLHEEWQVFRLAMQELFERTHALHDLLRWWRNKCSVAGPRASNPVLCLAEFAGTFLAAAPSGQENLVYFSYQAEREWEIFAESAKTMIHRCHII